MRRRNRPRYRHRAAHGLTLVELLLAVSITSLVGIGIAMMLTAVTYGTDEEKSRRKLVVAGKAVSHRLSAELREARMILAEGDSYVVLWMRDLDDNDAPSLLEIQRIECDSSSDEIRCYSPASGATDTAYTLADNFNTITNAIKGTADFPQAIWASDVTAWTIDLDTVDPQQASLVTYRLTVSSGQMSDTSVFAVALRN
ncbi:MAG: hypothetical protein MI741_01465 [Rhodospirillales bacterium]|nr:hypothetical protein [Rhodospirillales bacterium]